MKFNISISIYFEEKYSYDIDSDILLPIEFNSAIAGSTEVLFILADFT